MALPPPPEGLDLTETRVPEILGSLVTTWIFAVIAVGLRLIARRLQGSKLYADDWLVSVALIFASVHVWISIGYMVPHGTGVHIWAATPYAAKVWAQGLLVSELAYTISQVAVKLSTLHFYWRLFSAEKAIRIPIYVMTGVVMCWGVALFFVSIFTCVPTRAAWERLDPVNPMPQSEYTCGVDENKFFIGNSVPTIITDALIVAMPAPYVWRLQLRRSQKIAIIGIFFLGAFVTVISMVRFSFIMHVNLKSPDITWNFSDSIIWTNAEGNIAVICCCLPSLKPILNLLLHGTTSLTSGGSGPGSSGAKRRGNKASGGADSTLVTFGQGGGRRVGGDDGRPFTWLDDGSDHGAQTPKSAASDEANRLELGLMPMPDRSGGQGGHKGSGSRAENIVVTKQFELKSVSHKGQQAVEPNASYYKFKPR